MKKNFFPVITICLVFGLFFVANETLFSSLYLFIESVIRLYPLSFFLSYLIVGIPVFLYLFLTKKRKVFSPLGLDKNIGTGLLYSALFALPMFLGYGILSGFSFDIDRRTIWFGCVFAALFEEIYYRGFFFGELFKRTRLGFIPAVLLSALVFASLHLYQSNDPGTLTGIFITTFLGGGFFAWLYAEWNFNLWVPIGLHFFMNLSWNLFSVSGNAFGDLTANLIRSLTIIVAIIGTIKYKKRKNRSMVIHNQTLFFKNTELSE